MASYPTFAGNVDTQFNNLYGATIDAVNLTKCCRAVAISQAMNNNLDSAYVKNLSLIKTTLDSIEDSLAIYRASRGVTNFTVSPSVVNSGVLGNLTDQLSNLSTSINAVNTVCVALHGEVNNNNDPSAGHINDLISFITTQLANLNVIMDNQRSTAGSGVGITLFQELATDSPAIKGTEQLLKFD